MTYTMTPEHRAIMIASNHARKGKRRKPHSEETKAKMRAAAIGRTPSLETRIKIRSNRKGKCRGSEHYNWKGGKKPILDAIRHTFEQEQWRSAVFHRDEYTCQDCGDNSGGNLEAHHSSWSFADIVEVYNITSVDEARTCVALWDIFNGVTLCKNCHIERHKKDK